MRQYWVAPLPPFHTADGTAYNTSTTLTDVSPAPSIVIPANMLEVGSRLEFSAFGRFSNVATTPTLILGIYLSGGAIAAGNAIAATSAITTFTAPVTNRTFRLEGNAQVRAAGSGTAAQILGALEISNVTSNGTDMAPATAPTALGFDSTIANKVMIGAQWGASAAGNTLTVHYFGVRLVN
ncbi:MAG TPA: hypothetical protein VIP77_16220 [Jiangellaceae bacterium]